MIKKAVLTAFVVLLKVIAENYLPGFPISVELIDTIILALAALFGVDVVEFAAKRAVANLSLRGLWK